jgi:hypothetical protein
MKRLGAILIIIALSLPFVSYGGTLSAFGTATIDGAISPGEWDKAAKIDFLANVPPSSGGGTTPATLYVMNDNLNLYLAVKMAQASYGNSTQFNADFDTNGNGVANEGEDVIAMYVGASLAPAFVDIYRYTCPGAPAGSAGCFLQDADKKSGILPAGTNDGATAASNNGTFTVIEMSHPLKSSDTLHDFSLNTGDSVGMRATLKFLVKALNSLPASADTVIPAAGSGINYEQIKIASDVVLVGIDIKPGNGVNSINSKSEGKIPVALVSDALFNAPTQADRSSLTFGRTGDEQSLAFCNSKPEDVNGDGLLDLVCHFNTDKTGFQAGDAAGVLKGHTIEGKNIIGKDSIRIVGAK